MPRSTIIELSREKSTQQQALNSEWSNNMNEILNLPAGSVVQLKQAFIDEGAPFPANGIELEDDIDITMNFVYWLTDQNIGNPVYNNILAGDRGKGGLFIACKYDTANPGVAGDTLEGNCLFTIPAGIYDPVDLAELITSEMSTLNIHVTTDNLSPYTNVNLNTFLQSTAGVTHIYDTKPLVEGPFPGAYFEITGVTITPDLIASYTAGNDIFIAYQDEKGYHDYKRKSINTTMDAEGKFIINDAIKPAGEIKKAWSYPDTISHDNVAFYLAGDKAGGKNFYFNTTNTYYGASQTSLVYQNSRFNFSFLHSPHFIDGNGTVGVSVDNTALNQTVICANSGIAWISLEPQSFWEDTLGFNISKLTRTLTQYEQGMGEPEKSVMQFGHNITGGLVGNSTLPAQTLADGMRIPAAVYYTTTNQTEGILADNANSGSSNQKESFYYIDINGLESSKLYNEVRTDLNINSIISRYRSANGFITAYSEAGAQYLVEFPMQLSSFDVRILLSDYTPALTLGEASSIFLEVITPTEEELEQKDQK